MATFDELRRIALSLPEVVEEVEGAFSVQIREKPRGIAWVWQERIDPKRARVPNPKYWVVKTRSLAERDLWHQNLPGFFLKDPHYVSYPALILPLEKMDGELLRDLLSAAWEATMKRPLPSLGE